MSTKMAVKNMRQLFFGNTGAGVKNSDFASVDFHANLALYGIANCVANQVAKHNGNDRLGRNYAERLALVKHKLQFTVTHQGRIIVEHLTGDAGDILCSLPALRLALCAHQMQEGGGDIGGLACCARNSQQAFPAALRQILLGQKQLGGARNRSEERRAGQGGQKSKWRYKS